MAYKQIKTKKGTDKVSFILNEAPVIEKIKDVHKDEKNSNTNLGLDLMNMPANREVFTFSLFFAFASTKV